MRKVVKQVAGIDVAKDELVVCLGRMYDDLTPDLFSAKSFANTEAGFVSLVEWAGKLSDVTDLCAMRWKPQEFIMNRWLITWMTSSWK